MQCYVLEAYSPGSVAASQCERALLAAELGTGIRYVRTIFLPGDETLLHAFEATSPDALSEAAHAAGLAYERIVEAVERSAKPHELEARNE
jgi:hypothetical protein